MYLSPPPVVRLPGSLPVGSDGQGTVCWERPPPFPRLVRHGGAFLFALRFAIPEGPRRGRSQRHYPCGKAAEARAAYRAREKLVDECVDRGMVADVAFHGGDGHNPHVHVLLTTRQVGEDGFGQKERGWNDRQLLQHWREQWAERANAALERGDHDERIDHRTLRPQRESALERGDFQAAAEFDRTPPVHLGKSLRIFLRTGEVTERLERAEEVGAHNEERRTLRGRIRVLHSGAAEPEGAREAVERNMGTPGGRP